MLLQGQVRNFPYLFNSTHLFYLRAHSPHLNKIETHWYKVKYEWLRPEAYADFKTLITAVWQIPDRVGLPFTI